MKTVNLDKECNQISTSDLFYTKNRYAVIVVDDDEYFNKMLIHELTMAIDDLKTVSDIELIFSAYTQGADFLKDLADKRFMNSSMVVFLDYYLEKGLKASYILEKITEIDSAPIVIILSSTINKETSVDTRIMGAVGFMSKDSHTPRICRMLLEQIVSRSEI